MKGKYRIKLGQGKELGRTDCPVYCVLLVAKSRRHETPMKADEDAKRKEGLWLMGGCRWLLWVPSKSCVDGPKLPFLLGPILGKVERKKQLRGKTHFENPTLQMVTSPTVSNSPS